MTIGVDVCAQKSPILLTQAVALRMTHHKLLTAFSSCNSAYNAMKVFTADDITQLVKRLAKCFKVHLKYSEKNSILSALSSYSPL